MFPEFAFLDVDPLEPNAVLGTVTTLSHGRETWVRDGWIGYLFSGTTFVRGRWHSRGDQWAFGPDRPDHFEALCRRGLWAVLDGYWGERAELVMDPTREWEKARFESKDAVEFWGPNGICWRQATQAVSPGAKIISNGWDHEHCAICSRTIGNRGDAQGYVSEAQTWVCDPCFRDYVAPKSLAFIPGA